MVKKYLSLPFLLVLVSACMANMNAGRYQNGYYQPAQQKMAQAPYGQQPSYYANNTYQQQGYNNQRRKSQPKQQGLPLNFGSKDYSPESNTNPWEQSSPRGVVGIGQPTSVNVGLAAPAPVSAQVPAHMMQAPMVAPAMPSSAQSPTDIPQYQIPSAPAPQPGMMMPQQAPQNSMMAPMQAPIPPLAPQIANVQDNKLIMPRAWRMAHPSIGNGLELIDQAERFDLNNKLNEIRVKQPKTVTIGQSQVTLLGVNGAEVTNQNGYLCKDVYLVSGPQTTSGKFCRHPNWNEWILTKW